MKSEIEVGIFQMLNSTECGAEGVEGGQAWAEGVEGGQALWKLKSWLEYASWGVPWYSTLWTLSWDKGQTLSDGKSGWIAFS